MVEAISKVDLRSWDFSPADRISEKGRIRQGWVLYQIDGGSLVSADPVITGLGIL